MEIELRQSRYYRLGRKDDLFSKKCQDKRLFIWRKEKKKKKRGRRSTFYKDMCQIDKSHKCKKKNYKTIYE